MYSHTVHFAAEQMRQKYEKRIHQTTFGMNWILLDWQGLAQTLIGLPVAVVAEKVVAVTGSW